MNFKKTLIAAALVSMPVAGFSLEAMDDELLSGITGQDGITVTIATSGISADMVLHDNDGLQNGTEDFAGAITITGFNLATTGITVTVDAGDSVQNGGDATTPVLEIGVSLAANTSIATGAIKVGNSERDDAGWDVEAGTETGTIVSSMTINFVGGLDMNIQLGNEPQGEMISVVTNMLGGLSLSGVGLTDAGGTYTGGTLGASQIDVTDAGAADLGLDVSIDATAAGLRVALNTVGAGAGIDVKMTGVTLGNATPIGDLFIKNLNVDGTVVTIAGH